MKWGLIFLWLIINWATHQVKGQPVLQADTLPAPQMVVPGLSWYSIPGDTLFKAPQHIHLLGFHLPSARFRADIVSADTLRLTTSGWARRSNALAAVNGSYFNMKNGGASVFLQSNGQEVFRVDSAQSGQFGQGALALDTAGLLHILARPEAGWHAADSLEDILAAGPLLLWQGQPQKWSPLGFNTQRHPRTAVGQTAQGKWWLVTVDGRHQEAAGMSIPELAAFMKTMGCEYALNLDGGGSTTFWVKEQGRKGVVSYPSDNKQFDHAGQRRVANAVLLIPK